MNGVPAFPVGPEQLLERVLELAPTGILILGADDRVYASNGAFRRILGFKPDEHPKARSDLLGRVRVLAGERFERLSPDSFPTVRLLQGEAVRDLSLVLWNPRESRVTAVNVSGSPLRGPTGSVVGAIVTVQDVTTKLRTRFQIQLLETVERSILQGRDLRATCREVLRRMLDLTGATLGELWVPSGDGSALVVDMVQAGRFPGETPEDALEGWRAEGQALAARTETASLVSEAWRRGEIFWSFDLETEEHLHRRKAARRLGLASACTIPVFTRSRPVAVYSLFFRTPMDADPGLRDLLTPVATLLGSVADRFDSDAELRVASRAAETANLAKSAFLAHMSHEIRTPLNAILGVTELLQESPLNAEQADYLRTIRTGGQTLLQVVNDILDYSKMEAGKIELEVRAFDLRRLLEECVEMVAPGAGEKGLELASVWAPGLAARYLGDSIRLRQIVVNLLSNAVKFTGSGEVVLRASAEPLPDGRRSVEISVTDTGIGIPPEAIGRLFQSFSQVDPSHTRASTGTGLGLAISRGLAELMGGEISVESAPGQGSTFRVRIPLALAAGIDSSAAEDPRSALLGARVLFVPGSEGTHATVSALLEGWGMEVAAARNVPDGLALAAYPPVPALAVVDVTSGSDLPGLLEALDRLAPERGVPLVLLASAHQKALAAQIADERPYELVRKPVRPSALLEALERGLGQTPALVVDAPAVPPRLASERFARQNPLRILVAEDNLVNQRVARMMFRRLGYTPTFAPNGKEAVSCVQTFEFDVVFMDVEMPEMDGLEATDQVRRVFAPRRGPWIVAMTAHGSASDRERCIAAGMDDYISKPVSLEEIEAALHRAVALASGREKPWLAAAAAEASAAEEGRTLDEGVFARLVEDAGPDDPEAVEEIVEAFLTEAEEKFARAETALGQGRNDVVRRAAHSLKGSGGQVGATRLARMMRELEERAHTAPVEELAERLRDGHDEFGRVRARLSKLKDLRREGRHLDSDMRRPSDETGSVGEPGA